MSDNNDVQDLDAQLLKQMLQDFLEEANDLLDQLNLHLIQLEGEPENEDLISQIFRIAHTIKGSAGFAGLEEMSLIGRKMEDIFGAVRKGSVRISPSLVNVMFDALDVLTFLREKAVGGDSGPADITEIIRKLDNITAETAQEASASTSRDGDRQTGDEPVSDDLLSVYKDGYNQLGALKHLVYSSTYLYDEDTLAVLLSKQVEERMKPERNSFWLVKNGKSVVEVARKGKLVPEKDRQLLDISSSPAIQRVVNDQLVVWGSTFPELKDTLPGFDSPLVIPIKAQPVAYGFLVLDPEESAEVEVYQFVAEFASMILRISKLHQKVDDQRKELDEMTAILFRQNNILSSLYHVEIDLMRITNPLDLCRIVCEAFVHDLETRTASIFLKDESAENIKGLWGSGGLKEIDTLELPIASLQPVQQCLESGRIVSHRDFPGTLQIGANELENWIIMGLKGRDSTHGVVIAELEEEDITDSMSILANYSGILLDTLTLEKKAGQ